MSENGAVEQEAPLWLVADADAADAGRWVQVGVAQPSLSPRPDGAVEIVVDLAIAEPTFGRYRLIVDTPDKAALVGTLRAARVSGGPLAERATRILEHMTRSGTIPVLDVALPESGPVCPECAAGKHTNCDGTALDPAHDAIGPCACALREHG